MSLSQHPCLPRLPAAHVNEPFSDRVFGVACGDGDTFHDIDVRDGGFVKVGLVVDVVIDGIVVIVIVIVIIVR